MMGAKQTMVIYCGFMALWIFCGFILPKSIGEILIFGLPAWFMVSCVISIPLLTLAIYKVLK